MRADDEPAALAEKNPGLDQRVGSPAAGAMARCARSTREWLPEDGCPSTQRAGWRRPALATGVALLALACSELTAPPAHRRAQAEAPAAQAAGDAPPSPSTLVVAEKTPPAAVPTDQIEASHILVSYQGATRAKPTVTRTREQALEVATQLAARAREPGTDFAQLAKDASDGPSGVEGGVLPRFGRQQMVKPFSDAAFALRPGEISGVVETNFGFHIIKRLQ